MIKWDVSKKELQLIRKIAERAFNLQRPDSKRDIVDWQMDITACHANGNPLDLEKLLGADDFNFAHDAFGIAGHINRSTGQLENCFLPRCTARNAKSKAA